MNSEYKLKLFIAGMNPGSIRAIENVRKICDNQRKEKYDLEVIDIFQQRNMIKEMDIIAVPTLIRVFPEPERRMIGDMLDIEKIINILEL
ncbi:MAG: circadian clock KaiB family protein [Bacteroidota bacterium]